MASFHEYAKDCPIMGRESTPSKCEQKSWTWQWIWLIYAAPSYTFDCEATDRIAIGSGARSDASGSRRTVEQGGCKTT
jgi:hypothetical protein